jgi:hypothetical protein
MASSVIRTSDLQRRFVPRYEKVKLPGKAARAARISRNLALIGQRHGPQQRYRVFDVTECFDHLSGEIVRHQKQRLGTVSRVA